MSLEAAFAKLLEPLMQELRALRSDFSDFKETQQASTFHVSRLIYDAEQLQEEFGYSKHEAYAILRSHGAKQRGRRRITFDRLLEYQRGQSGDQLN